ncbi:hypothetical protein T439DRAFT_378053 [Meredithblackwellia eburnea MCA 4105]
MSPTQSPYNTFPRTTPLSTSGHTTPARRTPSTASFLASLRSSPAPPTALAQNPHQEDDSPAATSNSIYSRLSRSLSAGGIPIQRAASSASTSRYEDDDERARREGDPESWRAVVLAATGVDHARRSLSQQQQQHQATHHQGSQEDGAPPRTPSTPGTSGIVRRSLSGQMSRRVSSRGGTRLASSSGATSLFEEDDDQEEEELDDDRLEVDGVRALPSPGLGGGGMNWVEEPSTYAAVEQPIEGDADGNGLIDTEEEALRRMLEEQGPSSSKGQRGKGKEVGATSDSDSDDDSDDESPPAHRRQKQETRSNFGTFVYKVRPPGPVTKNVIKCVIAYGLAELFTFVPFLSDLVGAPFDVDGPVRNAREIATVSVYFNPAKTIGSMIEANLFALLGVMYAAFLCCGSMWMTLLLNPDHPKIAHAVVLIFWLGGGYGLLAFVKARVNKPTLTTACSLVSLICSVIITKEGAYHVGTFESQAILQVMIITLIGTLISNVVCFTLWPGSATSKLQVDLNKTLNSFSTLLEMLTKTFLLDEDITTRPESLKKAIDAHQASFTTLKSSLSQAKYEILDSRIRHSTVAYDQVVETMTRLAQGLTGMRSGCMLQYDLMNAKNEGRLDDAMVDGMGEEDAADRLLDELAVLQQFRERVGPSLKALAWTSKRSLALLRTSFVNTKAGAGTLAALKSADDPEAALDSDRLISLKDELEQSLLLFKRSHSQAIKILYQRLPANVGAKDPFRDEDPEDEGPNDNLFRIYYFCFNFEGWVRELSNLIETFVEIRITEETVARRFIDTRKRWGWFSFIPRTWSLLVKASHGRPDQPKQHFGKALAGMLEDSRGKENNPFPEIADRAVSSHRVVASQLSLSGRLKRKFWAFGHQLKNSNVVFSLKTGVGVTVLASAAFLPSLRPVWLKWRGEWALISYMVVMAPTIGATNFLALGRVIGTLVGAGAAVLFCIAFPKNAVALPLLGALFSVPCFYVIVTAPRFGPSSRFVLLTFNLTCLYSFNLREEDAHVIQIAGQRSIAVALGVLWGLVVTQYVWPLEARRELRKGLSEFFLHAAYLYERLVRTYSVPPSSLARASRSRHNVSQSHLDVNESTALLTPEAREDLEDAVDDFISMELHLQLSLIQLSGLLAATSHEPRLKGPFPVAKYKPVLASCQVILDILTSMRMVTTREAWYTTVRRDYVIPVNPERREMVGNVLLYFSVLSSAVYLKTPLPAFLPPAAAARDRLVHRLRELPVVQRRIVRGGSEGLLYLAYALQMKDVIAQLDILGTQFQSLFGIIGGASSREAFDALFTHAAEEEEIEGDGQQSSGGVTPR